MKQIVYLAQTTKEQTNYPLFPSGEQFIKGWNEEMAARLLPVALFDTTMAGEEKNSKAFFLYYEDYSISFLNWRMSNDMIIEIDDTWKSIRPFEETPDIESIKSTLGAYLKYSKYEIEIGYPSEYDYANRWETEFANQLEKKGAQYPMQKIRIGGGYPCYVQAINQLDDPGFIGEFPTSVYDLAPIYLYLSTDGEGEYYQELQMT